MDNAVKHGIHAVIIAVVLAAGSLLFPQCYQFYSLWGYSLTVAAYFGFYYLYNSWFAQMVARSNGFEATTFGFAVFMIADFVPGTLVLYAMCVFLGLFWASIPWLVSLILSVICEVLYMIGAFIQES